MKTKKAKRKLRTSNKRRAKAVRHARKMSALRGRKVRKRSASAAHRDTAVVVMGKRKRRKSRKSTKSVVLLGKCSAASSSALLGKGPFMAKKRKHVVASWFKKGKRSRRKGRGRGRGLGYMLGGAGGGRVMSVVKDSAATIGGAAIGSMLAARIPLPVSMLKFRAFLPLVAGVALGSSKYGRSGMGQNIAIGMVVAGGLALGRQFAPNVFAGEDEMLGLPMDTSMLGLEYQSGEEQFEGDNGEPEAIEGEDTELFGTFET